MMILVYFVAIWFQVVEDITEYESGIGMLPLVLALVVGSAMSGGLISAAGYYTPFMILGTVLMTVGGGLLTTLHIETTKAQWIGYQVLFGLVDAETCKCPAWQRGLFSETQTYPLAPASCSSRNGLESYLRFRGGNMLTTKLATDLRALLDSTPNYVTSYGATELRALFHSCSNSEQRF
jgi:hypothetical protein